MTREDVRSIVSALNQRGVRYLVVGGLAVVAHGYVRFTADLDLLVDPSQANLNSALDVLAILGYQGEGMSEGSARGMTAFSFTSLRFARTAVYIFTGTPFDFEQEWAVRMEEDVAAETRVRIVRLETLLGAKRAAARFKDLEDIRILENLQRDRVTGILDADGWPPGGFEGVERTQHYYSSQWSLAEKIAWLEEAQELAEFMQGQRRARNVPRDANLAEPGESPISDPGR